MADPSGSLPAFLFRYVVRAVFQVARGAQAARALLPQVPEAERLSSNAGTMQNNARRQSLTTRPLRVSDANNKNIDVLTERSPADASETHPDLTPTWNARSQAVRLYPMRSSLNTTSDIRIAAPTSTVEQKSDLLCLQRPKEEPRGASLKADPSSSRPPQPLRPRGKIICKHVECEEYSFDLECQWQ